MILGRIVRVRYIFIYLKDLCPNLTVSVLLGAVLSRLLNLLSTTDFLKCLEEMLSSADATVSIV